MNVPQTKAELLLVIDENFSKEIDILSVYSPPHRFILN